MDAAVENRTLTLEARSNGKLGALHVGIPHEGRVVVGGWRLDLADGEEKVEPHHRVRVRREGSTYTFERLN